MKTATVQNVSRRRMVIHSVRRDGSVLLIVLVIIALLSLAAYSFTEIMISEAEATVAFGRDVQARAFADSGIELAASFLGDPPDASVGNFYHNPELFQGILLQGSEDGVPRSRGRFSLVAPVENDPTGKQIRFGLVNESAKLNLNTLVSAGGNSGNNDPAATQDQGDAGSGEEEQTESESDSEARTRLMHLLGMTEEIADAILDFIDEDETERQYGAESSFYTSLNPPYEAKNKPLESLDELLLIRDVTPALLFGIDANRNGLIDASEEAQYGDVISSLGLDESPFGWSAYLTVHSRELNLRSDGTPRIHLNNDSLEDLYDELEEEYGEDEAKFVTAYRLAGPVAQEENGPGTSSSGNNPSGGNSNAGSSSSGGSRSVGGPSSSSNQSQLKGGLDISGGAKVTVNSIYDLIDAEVQIEVDGEQTTLTSPWSSSPNEMLSYLQDLMDVVSVTDEEIIEGRININQARAEVLLGIPEMTEELVDKMLSSQPVGTDAMPSADSTDLHSTTGWLLIEGLASLETMRSIAPHLTTGGGVYRIQAVGYYDEGGPMARTEAVLDATQNPPRLIFQRDISDLGRGFSQGQLNGTE